VSFQFVSTPDVQGVVDHVTPVTMFVFGNQVGWHRITTNLQDYVWRMLVLVWGPSTVNSVRVATIVNGTSCEGDPYANCGGVTILHPNTTLICYEGVPPDDPPTPPVSMMFLVVRAVPLLNLPAGAIVYSCYNDLVLSGFDVAAFLPITWRLQADDGLVAALAVAAADTC
jgi:hypothetical protein